MKRWFLIIGLLFVLFPVSVSAQDLVESPVTQEQEDTVTLTHQGEAVAPAVTPPTSSPEVVTQPLSSLTRQDQAVVLGVSVILFLVVLGVVWALPKLYHHWRYGN